MAKTRLAIELGVGTSLRRNDYTKAAERAICDALWHNSLHLAEAFGFSKNSMIIDVEIGVQSPNKVNSEILKSILPYGKVNIKVVHGGLDIIRKDASTKDLKATKTIVANAAIIVSFDMKKNDNVIFKGTNR